MVSVTANPVHAKVTHMKKVNKEKHLRKMQKLRRKMLKAWAKKRNEKASELRRKIILKTLKQKKTDGSNTL